MISNIKRASRLSIAILLASVSPAFAQTPTLSGTWTLVQAGKPDTHFVLTQSGDKLTGSYQPEKGKASPLRSCTVRGESFTCSLMHDKEHFTAKGTVTGDSMALDVSNDKAKETKHLTATRQAMM